MESQLRIIGVRPPTRCLPLQRHSRREYIARELDHRANEAQRNVGAVSAPAFPFALLCRALEQSASRQSSRGVATLALHEPLMTQFLVLSIEKPASEVSDGIAVARPKSAGQLSD